MPPGSFSCIQCRAINLSGDPLCAVNDEAQIKLSQIADAFLELRLLFTTSHSWPGGIVRLKFPKQGSSRSVLKLVEAFSMTAVDLATPGGWSWQLAS